MARPTDGAALTLHAVCQWAAAMAAALFDVRLIPVDASTGPPALRCFTALQLAAAVSWLRWMNRCDFHVYARPMDPAVVLVDDLCEDAVDALRQAHQPCAVVATSPGSYQVWVRLSADPVEAEVAAAAARILAQRYDGDPGAASAVQVGRLAGFANRKPCHERGDGSFPFARLLWAQPVVDAAGVALLAEAADVAQAAVARTTGAAILPSAPATLESWLEYEAGLQRLQRMVPAGALDRSRADYSIARRQLARGIDRVTVAAIIMAGDRAQSLPPAVAAGYAARTVGAARRGRQG